MKHVFFITTLLLLLSACGSKSNEFVPERLLNEQEMIDIMTDVQIIEADVNYQKTQMHEEELQPQDFRGLTRSYYEQLYEHYGITDSILSQNIQYYTEHPALLERIMDSVSHRLMKEQSTSSAQ